MSPKKETQKSTKSSTTSNKKTEGFTDEELAAMKERTKELKELTAAEEARIVALVKKAVS